MPNLKYYVDESEEIVCRVWEKEFVVSGGLPNNVMIDILKRESVQKEKYAPEFWEGENWIDVWPLLHTVTLSGIRPSDRRQEVGFVIDREIDLFRRAGLSTRFHATLIYLDATHIFFFLGVRKEFECCPNILAMINAFTDLFI